MEKGCNSIKGALCWILFIVFIFGTLGVLQYKFKFLPKLPDLSEIRVGGQPAVSPMPEVKFDPPLESPVLDEALKKGFNALQIRGLVKTLQNRDIKVVATGYNDEITVVDFLYGLLQDEESQKIFRQFSSNGITIYLANEYEISNAAVYVDVRDGFKSVKKVAKWLATGKK